MFNTIVTGDVHGYWGILNRLIDKKKPSNLIVSGDFGYWPKFKDFNIDKIKPGNTKIYWVPGNHEDWDTLELEYGRRGKTPIEIAKNIFYCPIGSRYIIDNKHFLFVGGADSVDKHYRIIGRDWFKQEVLNGEDAEYILSDEEPVDVVISHTCPESFDLSYLRLPVHDKFNDPSRTVLDIILQKYFPDKWYFGHWHDFLQGCYRLKTFWTLLNKAGDSYWWRDIV